jgi:hypothetical protein
MGHIECTPRGVDAQTIIQKDGDYVGKLHPLQTRESQDDLGKYTYVLSKEKVATPFKKGPT